MGFFALGDEVQFVPKNNELIKYSGVVEIHGIDLRGIDPVYAIRTKDEERAILRVTESELEPIAIKKTTTTRKK